MSATQQVRVKLQSSSLVHTPGILAWARNGFRFAKDRKHMVTVISETYGLRPEVATGLLDGSIPYDVEGDAVAFNYEGDYRK